MRASVVIACHNEGTNLHRTVASCVSTTPQLNYEIVIVDDASSDGSIDEARQRFPFVRIVSAGTTERLGCQPAKALGASHAKAPVLIFMDGHCKPEPFAIERLVATVEDTNGAQLILPRIATLDPHTWENRMTGGAGFCMDLDTFDCSWTPLHNLRRQGALYESPAFISCCCAVSKSLYEQLHGFDSGMLQWGIEDIDFGLKAWLLGHDTLVQPRAMIGHRFRGDFGYRIDAECVLANKLRMTRKNFTDEVWGAWLDRHRRREPPSVWDTAWALFTNDRDSVERERASLFQRRKRDELQYAEYFGLAWPRRDHLGFK